MIEEVTIFMARSKIDATLKRQKEKASVSSIYLDLEPLYAAKVGLEPYLVGMLPHNSKSLTVEEKPPRSMYFAFLTLWMLKPRC